MDSGSSPEWVKECGDSSSLKEIIYAYPLDTRCIIILPISVKHPGQSATLFTQGRTKGRPSLFEGFKTRRLHRKYKTQIVKEVQSDGFRRENSALS